MALQTSQTPAEPLPWSNASPSIPATQEHILKAMVNLHDNAVDTVWLTPHETVFERLADMFQLAGGSAATLAQMWPQYFADSDQPKM
jgi:hypothetical protein